MGKYLNCIYQAGQSSTNNWHCVIYLSIDLPHNGIRSFFVRAVSVDWISPPYVRAGTYSKISGRLCTLLIMISQSSGITWGTV